MFLCKVFEWHNVSLGTVVNNENVLEKQRSDEKRGQLHWIEFKHNHCYWYFMQCVKQHDSKRLLKNKEWVLFYLCVMFVIDVD